ncbi:hypothetical protein Tco_0223093 [Tanacetum coccineum]
MRRNEEEAVIRELAKSIGIIQAKCEDKGVLVSGIRRWAAMVDKFITFDWTMLGSEPQLPLATYVCNSGLCVLPVVPLLSLMIFCADVIILSRELRSGTFWIWPTECNMRKLAGAALSTKITKGSEFISAPDYVAESNFAKRNEIHHAIEERTWVLHDVAADAALSRTKSVCCVQRGHGQSVFFK